MTGGTGFFGKWLLHSFLGMNKAYGIDVGLTVLSRDPDRFLKTNPEFYGQSEVDFITGDVRSFAVSAGRNFDFVVHAATAASAKLEQENPDEMYSVITDGTCHILDCLGNRDIVIRGDGTPLRSYLYAADLTEWLWTILLRGDPGRAYNVGSDEAISILDLANLVRTCAGTQN